MRPYDGIWTVVALVVWLMISLAFDWPGIIFAVGAIAVIFTWRSRTAD